MYKKYGGYAVIYCSCKNVLLVCTRYIEQKRNNVNIYIQPVYGEVYRLFFNFSFSLPNVNQYYTHLQGSTIENNQGKQIY